MLLESKDSLTLQLKKLGITNWNELIKYIQSLAYGRNSNRYDLDLILIEEQGTCSSKHAFLKKIADLNKLKNIELYIGIYKMTISNTPKIGNILLKNEYDYKLDYIPEAHCYLKINGIEQDFTNNTADFEKLRNDILKEIEIESHQVDEFKVIYHQNFLRKWIEHYNKINEAVINFDTIWKLREKCISNLSM